MYVKCGVLPKEVTNIGGILKTKCWEKHVLLICSVLI